MLTLLLALGLPFSASAEDHTGPDSIPASLVSACESDERADTGLVHLRCGDTRLLVAQIRPLDTDVHDEILASVVDLVPMPSLRTEVAMADPDLRRSTLVQLRDGVARGEVSVHLQLTTRVSTGRSLACMVALVDRRRADLRELAWCDQAVAAMLPSTQVRRSTQVQVQEPDLPPDDLR